MKQESPLPELTPASVRNISARPAPRPQGHHSLSEVSLTRKLSLPAGRGNSIVRRKRPVLQERGRTADARPSTSAGIASLERPPLPRPSLAEELLRPASTGGLGLESRSASVCSTGGSAASSRRSSFSNAPGSRLSSRRGSKSSALGEGISLHHQVEHSFKPALFVSSSDQSRDSHPGGENVGRHPRKLPLKSFQGSLGESWGHFAWHRPLSGSRASTRASSRCSQSSLSTVGLEVVQSGEQQQQPDDMQGHENSGSHHSSPSSSASRSVEPQEPVMSPKSLADNEAAARWSNLEVPLPSGALFEAISLSEAGYEAQALAILARPDFAELNSTDCDECTALHQAARRGLLSVCHRLLDCTSFDQVNARDRVGRTVLHCAAAAGHAEVCSLLLDHPRFSAADAQNITGCTALHCAACGGSEAVCRTLLEHPGFDASAQDHDGETALHWAAWNGHAAACQLLLEHPRFEAVNTCDRHGRTPLHSAAMHGQTEACHAILKHRRFQGADVQAKNGLTALKAALKAGQYATHSALQKLVHEC